MFKAGSNEQHIVNIRGKKNDKKQQQHPISGGNRSTRR